MNPAPGISKISIDITLNEAKRGSGLLSFKLILWSFYKDYTLVHRAIPKSLRLEY